MFFIVHLNQIISEIYVHSIHIAYLEKSLEKKDRILLSFMSHKLALLKHEHVVLEFTCIYVCMYEVILPEYVQHL